MFVVFASFVLTTSIDLKELGFALAVVVLVDAALTRRLLVPAVLRLLGERAWAGPRSQPAPARSAQAASSGSVVTDGQTCAHGGGDPGRVPPRPRAVRPGCAGPLRPGHQP